jgi:hypothetical protein
MDETESGTLETTADAGKGKSGIVRRWLMAIDLASKEEREWRKSAGKVYDRYRQGDEERSEFNILWSNTEVMRPVLYNSTPIPDVRRTFKDDDPVGKAASEIIERALTANLDLYDFDHTMTLAVLDLLLPGRSVTRTRYEPTIQKVTPPPRPAEPVAMGEFGPVYNPQDVDDLGQPVMIQDEPYDQIVDQRVYCEPVHWDDFRRGPGGNWGEVEWIAFRHKLTRDQLRERFGAAGAKVELDYCPKDIGEDPEDEPDIFKRGIVWEVWDRKAKRVLFIAPSYKDAPLKDDDDPLGLKDFWPIPRPMYALETSDTLVPVELFKQYRKQADELDDVSRRIKRLVQGLKLRGVYDSTISVMGQLMDADDNTMLPTSDESLALLQTGGSLDRAIWMMPIEKIALVLRELYQQRAMVIQTIYEITGLSDIMRGATDASETATAQQIKAQTGSRRMRYLQREVQRYVRDLLRLKAEIIAEHFEPDIISMMTNKPVSPGVMQLLRDQNLRQFRVDIETDSTISDNEIHDRESLMNLLGAAGQYITAIGPAVQSGYVTPQAAQSLFESVIRHFRLGRKIEDAMDESERQMQQGGQEQQKSPEEMQAEAEARAKQRELDIREAESRAEIDRKDREAKAEIDRKNNEALAEIRRKWWETQQRSRIELQKAEAQRDAQRRKQETAA